MSNATNAGLEITINGHEYTFSPFTFGDYEWLELKLRARAIEAGRMSIPPGTPHEISEAMMVPVLEYAMNIDVFKHLNDVLTPVGITWLLWRMVSKKHPTVTMDEVGTWMQDKQAMNEITPKLLTLTGFKKSPNGEVQAPKKAKKTQSNHSTASGR